MNYPDVKEHWDEFEAKRTILTHMSQRCWRWPIASLKNAPMTGWW